MFDAFSSCIQFRGLAAKSPDRRPRGSVNAFRGAAEQFGRILQRKSGEETQHK